MFVLAIGRRDVVVVSKVKRQRRRIPNGIYMSIASSRPPRQRACPLEPRHVPTARRGQDSRTLRHHSRKSMRLPVASNEGNCGQEGIVPKGKKAGDVNEVNNIVESTREDKNTKQIDDVRSGTDG